MRKRTVGPITFGIVLTALGVGLLLDLSFDYDVFDDIVSLWPLALVLLGLEYIFSVRDPERETRLNWLAVIGLVITLSCSWVYSQLPAYFDSDRFNGSVRFGDFYNDAGNESYEVEREFTQAVQDGLDKLEVGATGSVTIVGKETDTVAGKATIVVRAPTREEAQRIAEQAQVEVDYKGTSLHIEISRPDNLPNRVAIQESYVLEVPSGVDVALGVTSGDADIKGITGNIAVGSVSGDIIVDGLPSVIAAGSVSGDVKITLGDAMESVECETVSGDVYLSVPGGTGGNLSFSSVSGKLSSPVSGIDERSAAGSYRAEGHLGTGDTDIEVETVSGDLSVERQRTD